jgi:hypothetical protein
MLIVATCFGLMRSSSGNSQLNEITTPYGFTRSYCHVIVFENVRLHFLHALSMLRRSRDVMYNICV